MIQLVRRVNNMQWIEPNEVDWYKLLDENKTIVVMICRGEVRDVVCGYVFMMNNRNELELESFHQGRFGFHNYEVEKVLILD